MKTLTKNLEGGYMKKQDVLDWVTKTYSIANDRIKPTVCRLPETFLQDSEEPYLSTEQLRTVLSEMTMREMECDVVTFCNLDINKPNPHRPAVKFTRLTDSGRRGGCTYFVVKDEAGFYYVGTEYGCRQFVDRFPLVPLFIYEVYDHVLQHKIF